MVDVLEHKQLFLSASMDRTVLVWSLPDSHQDAPSLYRTLSLAAPLIQGHLYADDDRYESFFVVPMTHWSHGTNDCLVDVVDSCQIVHPNS